MAFGGIQRALNRFYGAQNRIESGLNQGSGEVDKRRDIITPANSEKARVRHRFSGYPLHLEAQHERFLARYHARLRADIEGAFRKAIKPLTRADSSIRSDAPSLFQLLDDLRRQYGDTISSPELKKAVENNFRLLDEFAAKATEQALADRQAKMHAGNPAAPIGVNLVAQGSGLTQNSLDAVVRQNLALIRDLQGETFENASRSLREGLTRGDRYETIAKQLERQLGIDGNRARFWARDQASKFYGQVTRLRQKAAGIPGYIWRTMKDARVRDPHRHLEGTYHSWDKPPAIVRNGHIVRCHPGDDYNCRCWAEPAWDANEAERPFVDMVGSPAAPDPRATTTGVSGASPSWDGPPPWTMPGSSYRDFDTVEQATAHAKSSLATGDVRLSHFSDLHTVNLVVRALHDLIVDRGMPKIGGIVTKDFRSLSAYAYIDGETIVFPTAGWNGGFVRQQLLRSAEDAVSTGMVPAVAYSSHYDLALHEYGHLLFDRLTKSSRPAVRELIKLIMAEERWTADAARLSSYAVEGREEYFSEAFILFFRDRSRLTPAMQQLIEMALEAKL